MGKKLFMGFLVLALVGMLAGVSQAGVIVTWTDTTSLNVDLFYGQTYVYTHDMPADLEVPPMTIESAILEISYQSGSAIGLAQVNYDVLGSHIISFTGTSTADINIAADLDPWTVNTVILNVQLTGFGTVHLVDSKLTLLYDPPGDTNGTPVPEPSTLLLLGSGLLGIVAIGRKRAK